MRRFIYRSRYLHMRDLALRLQCVARQKIAKSSMQFLLQSKAALRIQTQWRRYTARQHYIQQRQFIVLVQTAIRSHYARKTMSTFREMHAAIQIQKMARGWYVDIYII